MNTPICGLRVASAIFGLICLGQLVRILTAIQIHIGSHYVHRWMSAVAMLVAGCLCVWLWRLASEAARPKAPPPSHS